MATNLSLACSSISSCRCCYCSVARFQLSLPIHIIFERFMIRIGATWCEAVGGRVTCHFALLYTDTTTKRKHISTFDSNQQRRKRSFDKQQCNAKQTLAHIQFILVIQAQRLPIYKNKERDRNGLSITFCTLLCGWKNDEQNAKAVRKGRLQSVASTSEQTTESSSATTAIQKHRW